MKHPSLEVEVPVELRKEIYKKALSSDDAKLSWGLCLLLPVLLWDLDRYTQVNPVTGEHWQYTDTPKAFPELTKERLDLIGRHDWDDDAIAERRFVLNDILDELDENDES